MKEIKRQIFLGCSKKSIVNECLISESFPDRFYPFLCSGPREKGNPFVFREQRGNDDKECSNWCPS